MFKIGQVITYRGKKAIVLNIIANEALLLREGIKQPQWIDIHIIKIMKEA